MARGDSTSDDKSRNHNRNNLDLKDGAFFTFNVKDTGFPPLPPQQPNFQPNLRSRRPQQNGYKATPGQIEGGAEVDEARALFNASARNGKSFAVVVYGESGNIEGQVRVPRTLHQRPQIELAITQFAGTTISDSSDRRHDSIEQSSEEYSRGNSLSSSSTQCTLPVRNHQTASRRKKRRASTPLSRCGTPADDEEEQEIVILEDKPMRTFRLGNVDEIRRFYRAAFDLVQQTAMKSILKYWIKVIEPDKQKKFPYSHGAQPPWWPKDAKYKEPDHIRSDDRLKLGVAILKVVVETGDRAMIKSLEKVTFEKASIVGEKDSPEKIALRKEILKQVFHLARREQEVYNDEIDGSAQIILFELAAFKAPTARHTYHL
ncbi:hypothetical protein EJ08DRAFT_48416 [Tothia fuscella]|uniref:Subtelomeric hrmA-associated cluster protein AFUB-079030/YDR124W-like helical bundle domain-containing protein n=1 Tax=Tothia fuscella TaxID=1048955 RepID=A0A9P4TT08_9PEZI|nr:hypothetical protein EJ08DRAFT_48416 [Tothia fuscella]